MDMETTIIGIDCSTDSRNVGLAMGIWPGGEGKCQVEDIWRKEGRGQKVNSWDDDELTSVVKGRIKGANRTLLAIDAPLGWPKQLGSTLLNHEAGKEIDLTMEELFQRRTDQKLREREPVKDRRAPKPLEVGADKISRTAVAALKLLKVLSQKNRPIPLTQTPDFEKPAAVIEVYPAATLWAIGSKSKGYKGKDKREARKEIIQDLEKQLHLRAKHNSTVEESDHVLDAVVCVLAGADFLGGKSMRPTQEEKGLAQKEGWIWVRK